MPATTEVTLERCPRPDEAALASLLLPFRPTPEGNGWYAHFYYRPDGSPIFKRETHGDHTELWYIVVPDVAGAAT
jgi:hypothetical protein